MSQSQQSRPSPATPSVESLDLEQWNQLVSNIDDFAVAHAMLEAFAEHEALKEKYAGIYLKLRVTKQRERVSYARACRRQERIKQAGLFIGQIFSKIMSAVSRAAISRHVGEQLQSSYRQERFTV